MTDPKQLLADRFSHAIVRAFGEEHAGVDPVIRPAQHPRFGDYQANVALSLGRTLGMTPREVAQHIVRHLVRSGHPGPVGVDDKVAGDGEQPGTQRTAGAGTRALRVQRACSRSASQAQRPERDCSTRKRRRCWWSARWSWRPEPR